MLNKDKIRVYTLPLPEEMRDVTHATFTATGSVLCDWHKPDDEKDMIRLSVCDKDGNSLRHIFAQVIPQRPDANGIRFMCFSDGKRVLLGDWVLECEPSIDKCESTQLLPVIYTPMEKGGLHWTEIVIDPSGQYMAWTALAGFSGSVNLIAHLVRYEKEYRLEDVKTICTLDAWVKDEQNEGYMRPGVMRGGEIKQFVRGGNAISMVGIGSRTTIADSVVQDLISGEMEQITFTPGYDETTIFSPDEKLGLVMSTRFSPSTNCAILSGVRERSKAS